MRASLRNYCNLAVHRRRGVVVVLVAVSMVALVGMCALSVDVARMYSARAELQAAADSGALAAAHVLATTHSGTLAAAREAARRQVEANRVLNHAITIDTVADVVFGLANFDEVTGTYNFTPTEVDPDSARVSVRQTADSPNGALPTIFARILGKNEMAITASAVATSNLEPTCRLWALNTIKFSGDSGTDSYHSADGPYHPASAGDGGNICVCGSGTVSGGGAIIDGDVFHGDGETFTLSGGATATGVIEVLDACLTPVLDFGDLATFNDNASIGLTDGGDDPLSGDVFNVSSDHITLLGGTYYFSDFTLSGGSTLTLLGPTTIYVTGNITVSGGGLLNVAQNPRDLTIISSGAKIDWSGGSDTFGMILAPFAEVKISGGGDFLGALVGNKVELSGGSNFHSDQSLPFSGDEYQPPVLIE